MNRRIRSIFWLMTFCIIGINAFQGYWLWTTYKMNSQRFNGTMRAALFSVLQQQQIVEAGRLFAKQGSKEPQKQARMIIRRFDSTTNREQIQVLVRRPNVSVNQKDTLQPPDRAMVVEESYLGTTATHPGASGTRVFVSPDTLARRISTMLLLDWAEGTRINLPKLWAAYHAELLQRGINANFLLDTVIVRPENSDKELVRQVNTPTKRNDPSNAINKIAVPINPVRNLFVQASFETPTYYLLGRMGWLLGSSAFFLLLTTGCFLFMLSTILRQKKLSEVKNDFINNMTHELKTPIATVTAAVDALQHFGALDDPQKTQTYLTISRNNLQRLSDLVEKVLNLAVEEKRELILHPETVNLSDLVNNLIANHQLRASKPVTFRVDIPDGASVQVDRVHFSNVLNNLIDNAINYSADKVDIHIVYKQDVSGCQLSVTDNGIGIPKMYQTAIFDRFFRVPTGDLHPVKGFGLGLAYARQVIERHGGRISVQSEPGKGSAFSIDF
ncbi:cell wall metabolism sensor histidine kinase WalK [Spirosoma sp. KNUC1025]|uniref:sensor histidine kinase n=1 Tax=Spirosoma sp. KNUC1025 TaxID=2894082 RepID=UPI00386ECFD0|nr:HAMP domain-containing histidine kinase [Spirosoma sp. KNUC1025]